MRGHRGKFSVSQRGTTLAQLREYAESIGFQCRAVKVHMDLLDQLQLPAILHWDLNHFVVLESVKNRVVHIVDPALGRQRLDSNEVSAHFTGVALEMSPTPTMKPSRPSQSVRLIDFLPAFRGLEGSLFNVFLITIALQVFTLIMPLSTQFMVDQGIRQSDLGIVIAIAIGFSGVVVVSAIANWTRSLLVLYVGNTAAFRVVSSLVHRLIRLPDFWFVSHHTGDVISRFESTSHVRNFLITGAFTILIDAAVTMGVLVVLFLYSPVLTLATLVFLILFSSLTYGTSGRMRGLTNEMINANARERTTFIENVERQRAIKLLGMAVLREDVWSEQYVESVNANTRLMKFSAHVGLANGVLGGLESITVLMLGSASVIAGSFTLGMMFAFISYANMLSSRSRSLIGALVGLRLLRLHLERISEISLENVEDGENSLHEQTLKGEVEVQELTFRYGDDQPAVLQEFNLKVAPGEFLVISGRSGSGKSTIIKLLCGLIHPQKGAIRIDGIDLKSFGINQYRRQLGVVMQDDDLFSGSLLENIAIENRFNVDKVKQAAREACIHDEIMRLPMEYHTLVGHMGAAMSGGQKQRVMIARAFYRKPAIFIMDEGTAHLNDELQQAVLRNLRSTGSTIIAVTHDDRVIAHADQHINLAG